jgi:hypothetical protein
MFYTIYKITNQINGKYYIGKHQTKNLDDGYMGSGKVLKHAIAKYGIENFRKEILHIFDNEAEMNAKEKELVVVSEATYNLLEGGKGGFGYINSLGLNRYYPGKKDHNLIKSKMAEDAYRLYIENNREEHRRKVKEGLARASNQSWRGNWKGKKHKKETIDRLKEIRKGTGQGYENSQYGTCWITDGTTNQKIKLSDLESWINRGFRRGRATQ